MRSIRLLPVGYIPAVLVLACGLLSLRAEEWKLAWSDEFNEKGVPDPRKWSYEQGFVRNEELQFYTRDRRENARIEEGRLVIEARREDFPNPGFKEGARGWQHARRNAQYTSACLITHKLHAWKYGRIVVRAKLPQGKGVWPAIWMLGETRGGAGGWPACGEIDIMEFVSHAPGKVHGTVHYAKPGTQREHQSAGNTLCDTLHTEFHDYGLEWNERTLAVTFDSKPYFHFDLDKAGTGMMDNPFRQPFYLLINLAVGGSWGKEADPAAYPQRFEIDWVRVYRKE